MEQALLNSDNDELWCTIVSCSSGPFSPPIWSWESQFQIGCENGSGPCKIRFTTSTGHSLMYRDIVDTNLNQKLGMRI